MKASGLKPLYWAASARKDLQQMPEEVQDTFGLPCISHKLAEDTGK